MNRRHIIGVVLALVVCGFVVGWIVAGGSGRTASPVVSSPYGSTQVGKLPAAEPFFITPLGKTPPPIRVLPKNLREYTDCLATNGKPPKAVQMIPEGGTAVPCEKLPVLKK